MRFVVIIDLEKIAKEMLILVAFLLAPFLLCFANANVLLYAKSNQYLFECLPLYMY